MNPDISRWPRMKLETHPLLDWVEISYSEKRLKEIADAVSKNPNPIQVKEANGMAGVWDPAIETLLRTLAGNRKALEALNHRRKTPPRRVVGLNRAVHYFLQCELQPTGRGKTKRALGAVADAWGVTAGQVKDDVRDFRAKQPGEYRSEDAIRLATEIIVAICRKTRRERSDVLLDFDADMRTRGATQIRGKK